ncbi:MAG: hypothetical protein LZF86_190537 [Nitrospira sp.]|nr:MAG: hypothetical protein LZF86_190537 [Nitrospira sp.]
MWIEKGTGMHRWGGSIPSLETITRKPWMLQLSSRSMKKCGMGPLRPNYFSTGRYGSLTAADRNRRMNRFRSGRHKRKFA